MVRQNSVDFSRHVIWAWCFVFGQVVNPFGDKPKGGSRTGVVQVSNIAWWGLPAWALQWTVGGCGGNGGEWSCKHMAVEGGGQTVCPRMAPVSMLVQCWPVGG